MPTAVVTGALERVEDMALALKLAGFEILAAQPDGQPLPAGLGEVDCYVQLPASASPAADQVAVIDGTRPPEEIVGIARLS